MNTSDLRALVARVQQHVDRATAETASADDRSALASSWSAFVAHMALGPEPETRECPKCARTMMREATLCGHCWARSEGGAPHA